MGFPLDHQGHVALKLHSGLAAYSPYIGLVSTGIVYPQQEDPDIKIDQYNYFDIIRWYHLLPIMVSGVVCIISLWYRMFS